MDKHYSITRAAKELGRTRPTVYKMIKDGKLRTIIIAGRPIILVADIEKLKRNNPR